LGVSETAGGGATRPLPGDGSTEKFRKDTNSRAMLQSLDQR